MKTVYICSPYKGDIDGNVKRAIVYCKFAFYRGYNPLAPHLYYPQFLDDDDPAERKSGMECAIQLLTICSQLWVMGDVISSGMKAEIDYAEKNNIPIRYFSDSEI